MTLRLLPSGVDSSARLLLAAKGLRAFADGFVAILLPAYLFELGFAAFEVGLLSTITLAGSAASTLAVGFRGKHFTARTLLLAATLVMAATGIGFAALDQLWPLLVIGFFGTLNPTSGDVSVFLPLEQAALARAAPANARTALFGRYSLIGALAGALGALAAGVPELIETLDVASLDALRTMFLLYTVIGLACLPLYARLRETSDGAERPRVALRQSRGIVLRLAALFSLDAFAGGFAVQSLMVVWLYERFGMETAAAGVFFFWAGLLMAGSYLVSVALAKRIGLINTMVFTHIPANLFLIGAAFAPTLWLALMFLLLRAALSQMDVPARTSYVLAVVAPEERAAAAAVTAVPRSLASALSPVLSGSLIALAPFAPLVLCGGLKIVYDVLLLQGFRKVKPPEEENPSAD